MSLAKFECGQTSKGTRRRKWDDESATKRQGCHCACQYDLRRIMGFSPASEMQGIYLLLDSSLESGVAYESGPLTRLSICPIYLITDKEGKKKRKENSFWKLDNLYIYIYYCQRQDSENDKDE